MSVYSADVEEDNIVIKIGDIPVTNVSITDLYLNNGEKVSTTGDFIRDQQKVNYLDSIKDGANVEIMNSLNIYPLAEENGIYPPFRINPTTTTLNTYEDAFMKTRKSNLYKTSWLKLHKRAELNPPKKYTHCLRESGLGYDVFMDKPEQVITVKTFGSYIDPIEKQNAKKVLPPKDNTIELTPKFMELMGFGEYSSVSATTKTNTTFDYRMNIGCGNGCNVSNQCVITHNGVNADPNLHYFAGNNSKNEMLKKSGNAKEKVKTIVVKEWGDKLQVLIYFILLHCQQFNGEPVTMVTCDKVVFMLCMNLSIPCICTGNEKDTTGKKMYSITEFKPSDKPYSDERDRLLTKIENIQEENDKFINAIQSLVDNPDTPITDNNYNYTFEPEFYDCVLQDLKAKQQIFNASMVAMKEQYNSRLNETQLTEMLQQMPPQQQMSTYAKTINDYIFVPFIKQSAGKLKIIMTKSYAMDKKNEKPAIEARLPNASKKSFYEIATSDKFRKTRNLINSSGGQRGGTPLSEEQINELFFEDEEAKPIIPLIIPQTATEEASLTSEEGPVSYKYDYITSDKIENEIYNPVDGHLSARDSISDLESESDGEPENVSVNGSENRSENGSDRSETTINPRPKKRANISSSNAGSDSGSDMAIEISSVTHSDYKSSEDDQYVFNPCMQTGPIKINLLTTLKNTFRETMDNYLAKEGTKYYKDNANIFKDTIYTLFVYDSFINDAGPIVFERNNLVDIIRDYLNDVVDEIPSAMGATAKGNKTPESSQDSLRSETGVANFSNYMSQPSFNGGSRKQRKPKKLVRTTLKHTETQPKKKTTRRLIKHKYKHRILHTIRHK